MIIERYKAGTMYLTQKLLAKTILFDKEYFWLQDVDGSVYLAKCVDGEVEFLD